MPNVWLVRSEEYEVELYEDVLNLLHSIPGVLSFHAGAMIDADTPIVVHVCCPPWQNIFPDNPLWPKSENCFYDQCRQFRLKKDVGEDEIVVLLTNKSNALNHFNGLEFGREKNLFVQTSDWEHYFPGSDVRYPVAYHVAVSVLIALWFRSEEEAIARIHSNARGCIMDFCGKKSEVSLKMRTADICESCLQNLSESGLGANVVNHTLRILEDIRRNMLFKSRWVFNPEPQILQVEGEQQRLLFPGLGSKQVPLLPLHRAFYLFYLAHPEGVAFQQLHRHEDEIFDIYNKITDKGLHPADGDPYKNARRRVRKLTRIENNQSRNNCVNNIRKAFETAVGKDLASLYCITESEQGVRRIEIDRKYVQYGSGN